MERQIKKRAFTLIGPKGHDLIDKLRRDTKAAFTLIELIVVMAVIGILVLLAAPKFLGYTQKAQDTKYIQTAKVIETALEAYLIHGGEFPDNLEVVEATLLSEAASNKKLIGVEGYISSPDGETYYELTHDFIKKLDVKISAGAADNKFLIEAFAKGVPRAVYSSNKGVTIINTERPLMGFTAISDKSGGSNDSIKDDDILTTEDGTRFILHSYAAPFQPDPFKVITTSSEYGQGPIIFNDIDEAIDGDMNTYVEAPSTITWSGDLTHREIEVIASIYGDNHNYYLEFQNEANEKIKPIGMTVDQVDIARNTGWYKTKATKFIVPEGATKIKLTAEKYASTARIYEVKVSNSPRPENIDMNFEQTTSNMTMTWDKVNRAVIYRDGNLINNVIGTTFTDTPLHSNKYYKYDVIFLDAYGNGRKISYDTVTSFHIASFRGVAAEAFDGNIVTYTVAPDSVITWTGDLTHREIEVIASIGVSNVNYYFEFQNDANERIKPIGMTVDQVDIARNTGYSSTKSTKFIVPEGATKIKLTAENYGTTARLHEVRVPNSDTRPEGLNVTFSPTASSMTLNWDTVNRALIYRDNVFLTAITGNAFTDGPLYSDEEYKYDVFYLDSHGNGRKITYNAKTSIHIAAFRGMTPASFDGNLNTYTSGAVGNVTWSGDLEDKEIEVTAYMRASNINYYLAFQNDRDETLIPQGLSSGNILISRNAKMTTRIKVPVGAVKIKLFADSQGNNAWLYNIRVIE